MKFNKTIISIDQNSNPLWDTVPKIDAIQAKKLPVTHLVEDIDAAFTRVGSKPGEKVDPALTLEQYYRNNNLDWGASLFYMGFLGRCPLNLHNLETFTGQKASATAKQLGINVDQLFSKYSPADNWQLTGSSYVNESADCHRLLGDLDFTEIHPFIEKLFYITQQDLHNSFPEKQSRQRIDKWLSTQRDYVNSLVPAHTSGKLGSFYRDWMNLCLKSTSTTQTSQFFAIDTPAFDQNYKLLTRIIERYDEFVELYNQSITETSSELSTIKAASGELPFFAIYNDNGHFVRSPMRFEGKKLYAGKLEWNLPLTRENFTKSPLVCISGKALLLVILARCGEHGHPLALPHNGSLYTPTSHNLAKKLIAHGFLPDQLEPILRIKMNMMQNWKGIDTIICPPAYLHDFTGTEISASNFAEMHDEIINSAQMQLNSLKSKDGRKAFKKANFPTQSDKLEELNQLRAQYGRDPKKRHLCNEIWDQIKPIQQELEQNFYEKVVNLIHASELDYWNSRGAQSAWAHAIGGEEFYQKLLHNTEIIEERS